MDIFYTVWTYFGDVVSSGVRISGDVEEISINKNFIGIRYLCRSCLNLIY